jgi:Holliday junction resolvasome RuvABC endonuclease subunit
MVCMLLPQAEIENEHAADALAIAITLAHAGDFSGKLQAAIARADAKGAVL